MEDRRWVAVRERSETAALASGVAAFAWQREDDEGVLIVDFIEEASENEEACSRCRVEGVSEERAADLARVRDDPFRFRDRATSILTTHTVVPEE